MLREAICLILLSGLLCGVAISQQFFDPFNYPPGTNIPGYTEHVGDWQATGTQVQGKDGIVGQTLIHNTIKDQDMCVETVAVYDATNPKVQRTGPIVRFSGSGSGATYYYLKVQDNGSPYNGFDRFFVYYQGGSGSVLTGAIPETKKARARLQVIEEATSVRIQVFIDTDMDGLWDVVSSTLTANGAGSSGGIGINGSQTVIADDLKYFNATLYLNGTPKVGTSVTLDGRSIPNEPYVGACSFGNSGFSIGAGRTVPLDLDSLFWASLSTPAIFQNFLGLTSANGDFTMTLNIPPITQLIGITIWSSAVTVTIAGFQEVAPDVEITFV